MVFLFAVRVCIKRSADNSASINTKTVKFHLELFKISLFEKKQFFTIFSSFVKLCGVLDINFKDHAIKLGLYTCKANFCLFDEF